MGAIFSLFPPEGVISRNILFPAIYQSLNDSSMNFFVFYGLRIILTVSFYYPKRQPIIINDFLSKETSIVTDWKGERMYVFMKTTTL